MSVFQLTGKVPGILSLIFIFVYQSCSSTPQNNDPSDGGGGGSEEEYVYEKIPYTDPDEKGDAILDFSRVGYKWGDLNVPDYPVVMTLEAPADGSDATEMIQEALDKMTQKGALLLKAGTWNISGTLNMTKSNVVLRGEGDATVLVATGKLVRPLIILGTTSQRQTVSGSSSRITDSYTPAGQMYVTVEDPSKYAVGDDVVIYRVPNQQWITDLKMDQIPPRADGGTVTQWQASGFSIYWERTVVRKSGSQIYLDNPVAMALDQTYDESQLIKYTYSDRITGSGIEDMTLVSEYASAFDENHAWTAIEIQTAIHCWVDNITSRYFGFGLVDMKAGSKNITVSNCTCLSPKSTIQGSRRYGFYFSGGQLCLVKNCKADSARHSFSSSAKVAGPNVFTRCTSTHALDDCGPHQRWCTGTLYDCVSTDYLFRVQDRSNLGSGHGWAGANQVMWNCTGKTLVCQSPWVSAKNYAIGCVGTKSEGAFTGRPDGVWESYGVPVTPESLYEQQFINRKATTGLAAPISCY